jgi:hypothetical protein
VWLTLLVRQKNVDLSLGLGDWFASLGNIVLRFSLLERSSGSHMFRPTVVKNQKPLTMVLFGRKEITMTLPHSLKLDRVFDNDFTLLGILHTEIK